jgi:hypothetical protein
MKPSFEVWMRAVDAELDRLHGVSHLDLSDVPYRDWFDDGVRASTAARRAAKNSDEGN